jgi:hypothetical protein
MKKSNLTHNGKTVRRKLSYVKTTRRTALKDEVTRSIIVNELANVTGLKPERAEAANVAKRAGGRRTDCSCDPCDLVLRVVEVEVHHELVGGWAIEDLRAFENPIAADMSGVSKLEGMPAEGPVNEISRRVAGDVSLLRIQPLCSIFSKPVPNVTVVKNSAAVRLDRVPLSIQPNGSRLNEVRLIAVGLGKQ